MAAKDYVVSLNPQPHPPAQKEADKKGRRQGGHYTDASWESAAAGAQVLPVLAVYVVILLVTTFLLLLLLILTTRPSSQNASSSSPAPFADQMTTSTVADSPSATTSATSMGPRRRPHGDWGSSSLSRTEAAEELRSGEDAETGSNAGSSNTEPGERGAGERFVEQLL
ncbi:hypothetical protein V5799_014206 [Amblyomma americanum]|uniref:Uncharacterized protein n=1 Tax=Amblyomma americanum TaxID=6943 RepID=A0AAQ4E3P5_AMBAM